MDTYIVNLRNPQVAGATGGSASVSTADGQFSLTGRVGLQVDRSNGDSRVWTMNATDFKFPGREWSTATNTYFSGLIAGETRKFHGASNDAFTTTSPLPLGTALRNKWLSLTHGALSGSGTAGISEMFRLARSFTTAFYICFERPCLKSPTAQRASSRWRVAHVHGSNSFEICLSASAQQISPLAGVSTAIYTNTGPISFSFGNLGNTAGASLQVLAAASNPTLVPREPCPGWQRHQPTLTILRRLIKPARRSSPFGHGRHRTNSHHSI